MKIRGIKGKSALVLTQQAPKYAVKSIHTINIIPHVSGVVKNFFQRSELILIGGDSFT